jgi:hypothetical protein
VPPNKLRPLGARRLGTGWPAPMTRLLFTVLLCALASSQATAQNWVSQTLLGLDEDRRNETFTYLLRDSNAKRGQESGDFLFTGKHGDGQCITTR